MSTEDTRPDGDDGPAPLWAPRRRGLDAGWLDQGSGEVYDPETRGLVFVPSGDAARTRRVGKLEGARPALMRDKYGVHRIGYWAPPDGVDRIEEELAATADQRAARRKAGERQRERQEERYRDTFREEMRRQYPAMPATDVEAVVARATVVGSGRVGRTKTLELAEIVRLAVRAHVRHTHTDYDDRLDDTWVELGGGPGARRDARDGVEGDVREVLRRWEVADP